MMSFLMWSVATAGLAAASTVSATIGVITWLMCALGMMVVHDGRLRDKSFFLLWPLFFVAAGLGEIFLDGPPDDDRGEPPTGAVGVTS